jgi:hypothetical protein
MFFIFIYDLIFFHQFHFLIYFNPEINKKNQKAYHEDQFKINKMLKKSFSIVITQFLTLLIMMKKNNDDEKQVK